MINCQAQLITGMYSSTLIHPLLYEIGLILALILLDYCQKIYAHQLVSFPDLHLTLFISLRKRDAEFQLEYC